MVKCRVQEIAFKRLSFVSQINPHTNAERPHGLYFPLVVSEVCAQQRGGKNHQITTQMYQELTLHPTIT